MIPLTLYELLEVSSTASAAELRAAYKALAMRYHPDRTGGNQVLEKRFLQIKQAWLVLSDPSLRAEYDRSGESPEVLVDNSRSRAIANLTGIYTQILTSGINSQNGDPLAHLARVIRKTQRSVMQQLLENRKLQRVLESNRARIRKKASARDTNNIFSAAVDGQIKKLKEGEKGFQQQIEEGRCMLELLQEYELAEDSRMVLRAQCYYQTSKQLYES